VNSLTVTFNRDLTDSEKSNFNALLNYRESGSQNNDVFYLVDGLVKDSPDALSTHGGYTINGSTMTITLAGALSVILQEFNLDM